MADLASYDAIRHGSNEVTKVYVGDILVWPPITTPEPSVISYEATHTQAGMTFAAVISNANGPVTLRASSSPLTGQTGFYLTATPASDGSISLEFTAFTNTTTRYWQLELGDNGTTPGTTILASGQVPPSVVTPPPDAPTVTSFTATHTTGGMIFDAVIANANGPVTLRASASPLAGQTGFYLTATPAANGSVHLEFTAFTNTNTRYWQLEQGDNGTTSGETILASGQVSPGTTPPPQPEEPTVTTHTATYTTGGMQLAAVIANVNGPVTLRASSSPLTGQIGFYLTTTPDTNGNVSLALTAFTNTNTRYWQLELGDNGEVPGSNILVSGQGAPSVTTPPPSGTTTGGSGGPLTNRTRLSHTGAGYTADYHLYASGLNWSQPVGLLVYIDGTGEYGIENVSSTYLMAGTNGMIAVAKRRNMILLTPFSPDRAEQSWHYNDPIGYTDYLETLIRRIYSEYNIDKTRFIGAGYSSGAQVMSRYLTPRTLSRTQPPIALDGVMIMISFGGHPAVTMSSTNPQPKANMKFYWNVGDQDEAAGYDGSYGALVGEQWYRTRGYNTTIDVIPGGKHARSDFGSVVDTAIGRYL